MIKYPRSKFGTTSRPESRCYSPASQFYCVIASRFLPTAFQFAIDFEIFLIARCRSRANEEQVTCRMKRGRLWVQLIARAMHETGNPHAGTCLARITRPVMDSAGYAGMCRRDRMPCDFLSSGCFRDQSPKPAGNRARSPMKVAASCFLAPDRGPSSYNSARTDKVLSSWYRLDAEVSDHALFF